MQGAATVPVTVMTEEEQGAAAGEDQVRAHTYSLLGALLTGAPSPDLLQMLAAVDADAGAGEDFAAAWRELSLAAGRAEGVDAEYQDLFIGLGRGEVVPYGSWYMTGFLMDKPLALLRGDLAALGFERQDDVKEPEDHAGALCETMALLVNDAHPVAGQREFYQAHMEPWMATFFRDLRAAPSASFYRAVGQFGEQFIKFESGYLSMLV